MKSRTGPAKGRICNRGSSAGLSASDMQDTSAAFHRLVAAEPLLSEPLHHAKTFSSSLVITSQPVVQISIVLTSWPRMR